MSGKNLFNGFEVTPYNQSGDVYFDGTSLTYKRTNANTYSGGVVKIPTVNGQKFYVSYSLAKGTANRFRINNVNYDTNEFTFTAQSKETEIIITRATFGSDEVVLKNIQIELGDKATPYVDYKHLTSMPNAS